MNMQTKQGPAGERISALMDGELGQDRCDAVLPELSSADGRERWQLYHLIGDVLRAPELGACGRDPGFVQGLALDRQIQQGPATAQDDEASQPTRRRVAANDGVFRWKLVAGLASLAVVAVLGWGSLGSFGPASPMAGAQMAAGASTASGEVLRDPELDQMLAAHREAARPSPFGNSPDFLRNAVFEGPAR